MTRWHLTRALPADIDALTALEQRCFPLPWGRLSFEGELAASGSDGIVARFAPSPGETRIVGYVFSRCLAGEASIFRIAVAPEWRRRGIGSRLVAACLLAARRRGATAALLEVRASNTEAIAMYQSGGFRTIAVRPGYYSDTGENALILKRELGDLKDITEEDL